MSWTIDKIQDQVTNHSQLRELPEDELQKIVVAHEQWASVSPNPQLPADLSGCNLGNARLSKRNLRNANISRSNLKGADLSGAILSEVNFEKSILAHAVLDAANLQGANLAGTNLQAASLQGANLQKAYLADADLQEARLTCANLGNATLNRTNLRNAGLQDANLKEVTGLSSDQLAGANVSGAKLPEDISKFEGLSYVEEISKKAGKLFIAIILGCVYAWLTIATTIDARLLTNTASSPLPIIQTEIPIAGFYWFAPLILLALYIYFHLYLQHLWKALADLPAIFPDGKPLDEKVYPWILNSLVRAHVARLREPRLFLSRLEVGISTMLGWWIVPATLLVFWGRYLPRHDALGTGFQVSFFVLALVSGMWFQQLTKATLRGQPLPIRFRQNWKVMFAGFASLLLTVVISDGAINGMTKEPKENSEGHKKDSIFTWVKSENRQIIPKLLPYVGARAFADLTEQDVSTKPLNWFLSDEKELTRIVNGAQLSGLDLQHASLVRAFMVRADLRGAQLQGANLEGAQLQKADLSKANLQRANLSGANLEGANLQGADLQEANLTGPSFFGRVSNAANLQGADLSMADLRKAELGGAKLQGARLFGANLKEARLYDAQLQGADLRYAQLQEAELTDADLSKAMLLNAQLHKTRLRNAQLQGANLSEAQLQKADLRWAKLEGASGLTQQQINEACVDARTKLPPGLIRPQRCVGYPNLVLKGRYFECELRSSNRKVRKADGSGRSHG